MRDDGGDDIELTVDLALKAYSIGVFPMAEHRDATEVYWLDPRTRGVLPLDDFRIPKRLRRTVRQGRFQVYTDRAFDDVIDACAESTFQKGREDSWINDSIRDLFRDLFDAGYAHTIECWRNSRLVGGLYGLAIGGAFFGESMFSRETDASKVALVHLAARLNYGGYTLLDAQFPNPHLAQFGAEDVPKAEFRRRLDRALDRPAAWPKAFPAAALERFLRESAARQSAAREVDRDADQ